MPAESAVSTMGSKLAYYKNNSFERVLLNGNICEILRDDRNYWHTQVISEEAQASL